MFLPLFSAINLATSEFDLLLKSITFLAHELQNEPFEFGIILSKFSEQGLAISKVNFFFIVYILS
ncbi:hypothetical protein D3C87_2136770 [compost metagenome]